MEISATQVRKPRRIFYGWFIALIGLVCSAISSGAGAYTFSVLLVPMTQRLGVTRTALTGVLTLRTLVSAFTSPFLAPLADKRDGPRLLLLLGGTFAGLGLLLSGQATALWHFYITYGILWGISAMSMGDAVSGTVVSKWFIRRRGRALALAAVGISVGGVIFTPLSQFLLSAIGLQGTWAAVGILAWALVLPLAFFVRRSPEDMGLLPDGMSSDGPQSGAMAGASAVPSEVSWTRKEAVRTPALWLIIASTNCGSVGLIALLTHLVPYVRDKGFSGGLGASVLFTYAIFALIAKPTWGFLSERFKVQHCVIVSYLLCGLGYVWLVLAQRPEWLFPWVMFQGLAQGGFAMLNNLTWANYYGRTFLGGIRGIVGPFTLVSSALGPLFAAYVYDLTGTYNGAFLIYMGISFLGSLFMFLARPPLRRPG